MQDSARHQPSTFLVVLAFATVYIVWGSTYFFIQIAVRQFPPMIMGAIRFIIAGILLLTWCIGRGEAWLSRGQVMTAVITGLLLLLVGNGAVMFAEQWLPSSLVAVLISTVPFWFVLLDARQWKASLRRISVFAGLIFGFVGVTLMFGEKVVNAVSSASFGNEMTGLLILLAGTMSWAGGSIYSKYRSSGSATINSAWQQLAAGIAFLGGSFFTKEWRQFDFFAVTARSWFAISYLILFGSIAAYSAYTWLLRVRSTAQVSTYAYVNPVIAVLLGVFIASEPMSLIQVCGLVIILGSVLLINLSKYRKA